MDGWLQEEGGEGEGKWYVLSMLRRMMGRGGERCD